MSDEANPTRTIPVWDVLNYRTRALEMAIASYEAAATPPPAEVVKRAEAYVAFLFAGVAPLAADPAPAVVQEQTSVDPQPQPEKPARAARKAKDTSGSVTPAPTASPGTTGSTQSATSSPPAAGSAAPDVAALRAQGKALVMDIAKKQGRDIAVELLSKFDATAVSVMDEARLPGFIPVAAAVLAGTAIDDALALADAPEGEGEEDLSDLG